MRPTVVPSNFALVERGVYRSSYPANPAQVATLRLLGLRTVAVLSVENLPPVVRKAFLAPTAPGPLPSTSSSLSPAPTTVVAQNTSAAPPFAQSSEVLSTSRPPINGLACLPPTLLHLGMTYCKEGSAESNVCAMDALSEGFVPTALVAHALDLVFDATTHPLLLMCPTGEVETGVVIACARRYMFWCISSIFAECQLFSTSFRSGMLTQIEMWNPDEFLISEQDVTLRKRIRASSVGACGSCADGRRGTSDAGVDDNDRLASGTVADLSPSFRLALAGGVESAFEPLVVAAEWPTWYVDAVAMQTLDTESMAMQGPTASSTTSAAAPPHEVFRWTRNPPALDPRSTFSATDSIVDEDDD